MSSDTERLQRQFKALADPHRLRLVALCRQGEISVTELTEVLGQSQPRVSQHLKHLCEAGLLRRIRDGKRAYYRLRSDGSAAERRLLSLIPESDPRLDDDVARLRKLRGNDIAPGAIDDPARRAVHRALMDLTVTAPLGDLLDIGCGRGRILKLLASRANRAIGVDIDSSARDVARAELLLAGLPNCSLRQGDMYRLPFDDASFDTIVLDDVLAAATQPVRALREAGRLLRPGGRLLVLNELAILDAADLTSRLAEWSASAGLRLAQPRLIPSQSPSWLLSVATTVRSDAVAA